METLQARFDAVQEQLLEIYEQDTSSLDVQITYWTLIRHEQALYYYARRQGILRLGIYQVPPTGVSEKKAKDAIKMTLFLKSLQKSEFAAQPWSLPETSLERFLAAPENTFKKRGQHVTVIYDKDSMNAMEYTLWTEIYAVDDNDQWHKYTSGVDYDGIYFTDAQGNKNYYVSFADDAALYSKLGHWEVQYENQVLSPPVTSSLPPGPNRRRGPQTRGHPRHKSASFRRSASSGSDTRDSRGRSRSPSSSRSRSRSRSRSPSGSHSRPRAPHVPDQETGRPPGGGGRRGSRDQQQGPGGPAPPSPGEVGTRSGPPETKAKGRLAELISAAYDPPVLLLQGCANTLKSFRRRTTQSYPHTFLCMSTSWTWASKTCTVKSGHRMLVAFVNSEQRTLFLATVKIPKGVTCLKGSFDGL
ncbi:putative regulatory protein E2 [Bos taurus papillomavirus 3]|uniref:Regulatory protein E2 n=1 Tax=Bovine papillomavirus type 3 TaxID=2758957 RepID=VE2_BPV3|nr:putative regulatory protein E2 [Xipapillomavirus 1]Q8BDD6.1 RecName: Full=Regulatory protein E2 [Bos taurus papillomavirus 3]AAN09958.1 putative regulatory protein E2 [Bos taurus papillomavirus 3]CAF05680.1 E2 protein [Xipapillomavirus 1]